MADIYVMVGLPGSGKSTFLKNFVTKDTSVIVSRDEIRFSFLKKGEDYFSHEDEVVKIFWHKINEELAAGHDVFVDQTSINPRSRKWLLKHVNGYDNANIIWIDETLETCIKNNEKRKETNRYVPIDTIISMKEKFVEPSLDEGFYRIYHYSSKNKTITYKEVI